MLPAAEYRLEALDKTLVGQVYVLHPPLTASAFRFRQRVFIAGRPYLVVGFVNLTGERVQVLVVQDTK